MSKAKPSWIQKANAQIKKEQEDESVFFKIPEGETEILVNDAEIPIEISKSWKKGDEARTRYQYKILVDGQEKTLEVGRQLHRLIIKALMQDLNPMTIIRAGTDINTKYGIKGLMK